MNKTLLVLALACLSALPTYAIERAQGWCEQGGIRTVTGNGWTSTGYFQRSFPACTVTIYLAGTNTLATIYSTDTSTPKTNPFLASTTAYWFFYAADGNYDVQFSGAGITTPFKLSDVLLISSSGGGGGGTVTTTGSPASGELTKFSGATSITNGNLTGDVTTTDTLATTLATVNSNAGSFGDATHVGQFTVNAKGLITAAASVAITGTGTGAFSAITSGTNTTAAMIVSSGASLTYGGTGVNDANKILGTTLTGLTGMIKMASGIPSVATSGTDYVGRTTATTYTAGAKQTVSQSASTAGLNLGALSTDPSIPAQGDVWYNGGSLKYRSSAATVVIGGGTAAYTTVSYSATPGFVASSTTSDAWIITLTGNVTSSTLSSATTGEILTFNICQDGTGSRTFVFPVNVLNAGTIDSTASSCSHQTFVFDGTFAQAIGVMTVTGIPGSALAMPGSTSGTTVLQPQAIATGTTSLPTITGSLPLAYFCGATTGSVSCANTSTGGTGRVIGGIATLASNSAVISSISPAFTSTSTYTCTANDLTTRANPVQVANTSASSITITNTTGASDVINYICIGY